MWVVCVAIFEASLQDYGESFNFKGSHVMLHAKTKTRLLMTGAALSLLMSNGAFAQTSEGNINDFDLPTFNSAAAGASAGGAGATAGDNLGDHTATEILKLGFGARIENGSSLAVTGGGSIMVNGGGSIVLDGGKISGVGTPILNMDVPNKLYVDQAISNAQLNGDDMGNHVATMTVNMSGNRVTNVANPVSGSDAVNRNYMQSYVSSNSGDNLGSHLATQDLNLDSFRIINLPAPQNNTDAVNKTYVDQQIAGVTAGGVNTAINPGQGITGGGPLTSDVTIAFDTAFGDNRYASKFRSISGGDGLLGGGSLGSNITLSVDSNTVVRTTGNQNIGGIKTFTGTINADLNRIQNIGDPIGQLDAINLRTLNTAVFNAPGDNLGTHKANRVLDMSNYQVRFLGDPTSDSDAVSLGYLNTRLSTLGSGTAPCYFCSSTPPDNLGNHTATTTLNMNGRKVINLAAPTLATDGVTKQYVDTAIATSTSGADNLGNHTATLNLNMAGRRILNVQNPAAASDAVNRGFIDGLVVTAGDGLAGGGALSANPTVAVDGTVVRTSGTQTIGGSKTFSGTVLAPTFNATSTTNGGFQGIANDSAALPSFTWSGDTNTGIYRVATDDIGFTTGGAVRVRFRASDAYFYTPINVGNNRIVGLGAPVANTDAATKGYVDAQLGSTAGDNLGNHRLTTNLMDNTGRAIIDAAGGWHRSYGDTGWYNGTYGGGWYMSDTTWVRSYQNKNVYTGGVMRAGALEGNGSGITSIDADNITTGTLNENRLPANYRRRLGGQNADGFVLYNNLTAANGAFYGGSTNPTNTGNRLNYQGLLFATRFYSQIYLYHSDERLKHDITDMAEGQTANVLQLQPKTFTWNNNGEEAMGFIAQDIEKIFPLMVKTDEDGMKAVDYAQMISPLVKTIQEMNARLVVLEAAQ